PVDSPLCSSSASAWLSSRRTFVGQRPAVVLPALVLPNFPWKPSPRGSDLPAFSISGRAPPSTRQASTFSAPVPCARTVAATVPDRGLRATTTGSNAGLSAVPQPAHCCAASEFAALSSRVTNFVAPSIDQPAIAPSRTPITSAVCHASPGLPLRPLSRHT